MSAAAALDFLMFFPQAMISVRMICDSLLLTHQASPFAFTLGMYYHAVPVIDGFVYDGGITCRKAVFLNRFPALVHQEEHALSIIKGTLRSWGCEFSADNVELFLGMKMNKLYAKYSPAYPLLESDQMLLNKMTRLDGIKWLYFGQELTNFPVAGLDNYVQSSDFEVDFKRMLAKQLAATLGVRLLDVTFNVSRVSLTDRTVTRQTTLDLPFNSHFEMVAKLLGMPVSQLRFVDVEGNRITSTMTPGDMTERLRVTVQCP